MPEHCFASWIDRFFHRSRLASIAVGFSIMNAAHKEPVAVVTGASSGIGRSIALELGKSGHILHFVRGNSAWLIEVRDVAPQAHKFT